MSEEENNNEQVFSEEQNQQIIDMGIIAANNALHNIRCLTIIGQIEGHYILPPQNKTTKYEHIIPALIAIEEDSTVEGLLIVLNTVGGDVEAVRMNGMMLGVPQTMYYFEKMQDRITRFVISKSKIKPERFTELMMERDELVLDVGTVLDGKNAVKEGLIDYLGGLSDAVKCLYKLIENDKKKKSDSASKKAQSKATSKDASNGTSTKKTNTQKITQPENVTIPKKRGRKSKNNGAAAAHVHNGHDKM